MYIIYRANALDLSDSIDYFLVATETSERVTETLAPCGITPDSPV